MEIGAKRSSLGFLTSLGPLRLLLEHDPAQGDAIAMTNISNPQFDQITPAQFAIDAKVE